MSNDHMNDLIAEARRLGQRDWCLSVPDIAKGVLNACADALEAATREPGEDYREALARVMDTLAYYHCRSVNPKADHPRMGYHAMTEDQREHLREKQSEAAEEIMRMVPSLSRAAVPDAAPEGQVIIPIARIQELRAAKDAALAAVGRVRAALVKERAWHEHLVASGDAVPRNVIGIGKVEAALDGAPEPEVKP